MSHSESAVGIVPGVFSHTHRPGGGHTDNLPSLRIRSSSWISSSQRDNRRGIFLPGSVDPDLKDIRSFSEKSCTVYSQASEVRIFVIQSVFDAPPPVSHREFRSLAATGSVILHEHRLKERSRAEPSVSPHATRALHREMKIP